MLFVQCRSDYLVSLDIQAPAGVQLCRNCHSKFKEGFQSWLKYNGKNIYLPVQNGLSSDILLGDNLATLISAKRRKLNTGDADPNYLGVQESESEEEDDVQVQEQQELDLKVDMLDNQDTYVDPYSDTPPLVDPYADTPPLVYEDSGLVGSQTRPDHTKTNSCAESLGSRKSSWISDIADSVRDQTQSLMVGRRLALNITKLIIHYLRASSFRITIAGHL